MKQSEVQHQHTSQPTAVPQNKGVALEAPQGESLAQLEAVVESNPQVAKSAQLAAAADASPTVAAQRRMADLIRNSPAMTAQRKWVESVGNSPSGTAQAKFASEVANAPHLTAQRQQLNSFAAPTPQQVSEEPSSQTAQRTEAPAKPNHTGLPDNLKSGIESLSGLSMDNVKVHYNSSQPAQLNALAYAQGTDIHVAPGQEKHLPHEAWHVVQQAQGRVKPTMQAKGTAINDDAGLEAEADVMGGRASSVGVVQGKSMESDRNLSNVLPKQLARIPVGFDRVSAAKDVKSDSLVTDGLANCIAVAVQDAKTGYAVMGHLDTGKIDHQNLDHYRAFRALLINELTCITGADPEPSFHVCMGALWLSEGRDVDAAENEAWWNMRNVILLNCVRSFGTEPREGGGTAEFVLAEHKIRGSGLLGVEAKQVAPPSDDPHGRAGDEIPYSRLKRGNVKGHKLDKNMGLFDKLSVELSPNK